MALPPCCACCFCMCKKASWCASVVSWFPGFLHIMVITGKYRFNKTFFASMQFVFTMLKPTIITQMTPVGSDRDELIWWHWPPCNPIIVGWPALISLRLTTTLAGGTEIGIQICLCCRWKRKGAGRRETFMAEQRLRSIGCH